MEIHAIKWLNLKKTVLTERKNPDDCHKRRYDDYLGRAFTRKGNLNAFSDYDNVVS